jgi:hypothetical protein
MSTSYFAFARFLTQFSRIPAHFSILKRSLSSKGLHQGALKAVGAEPNGGGAVMFDVGAHVGETALALALEFPEATIHAFEPVKDIFARLQWNCRKYPNVICHHAALGSKNEKRAIALRSHAVACTMNQMSHFANENTPLKW